MNRLAVVLLLLVMPAVVFGQHNHGHDESAGDTKVIRPTVFLDKNPKIVAFQLKRLSNEQLLLVETATDDKKYIPVFQAILSRDAMPLQQRETALNGLVTISGTSPVVELLAVIETIKSTDSHAVLHQLTRMLVTQPTVDLQTAEDALRAAANKTGGIQAAGMAGLITAGKAKLATELAVDDASRLNLLSAIGLAPTKAIRSSQRPVVVDLVSPTNSLPVRSAAIETLAKIPADQDETFNLLASLVADGDLRVPAIRTLLQVPEPLRDANVSKQLVDELVNLAEQTPPAQRTSDDFVDAMQLADQLMKHVSIDQAKAYRIRLREVSVRVVKIRTLPEEMRYDIPYFAVEAGRPVQLLLQNDDLMPHNLVITVPDALKEVAIEGAATGTAGGKDGKHYVPPSDKVLFATNMINAHTSERLTFDAPTQPGEYPFVCTFPNHWMRMYGVMVVVDDLDAWLQEPTVPKDPIGNNRSFVQNWTVEDLSENLDANLRGRSFDIGMRLFQEASCASCHKVAGVGGAVGPDLTESFKRNENNAAAVLREILEPSHKIDPKFTTYNILTLDGVVLSGIVTDQDDNSVTLVANPESQQPAIIQREDIDEMAPSAVSMMPKGLMDNYTQDEIMEVLGYLKAVGEK